MNRYKIVSIVLILMLVICGCDSRGPASVDKKVTKQQQQSFKEMNKKVGVPNITKWQEAEDLKTIYELKDKKKLICFLYTRNEYTGKYIYEGRCRGFGIGYSTQFSNPELVVDPESEMGINMLDGEGVALTKPQPEPNGLYLPASSTATWVMKINEKTGKAEVEYYEPTIVVTQSKKPERLCETYSLPKNYNDL